MNKRFFTLMAAVMLAGAPLCNEAYAVSPTTVAVANVKLADGVKFVLTNNIAAPTAFVKADAVNKTSYVTFTGVDATAINDAAVFEIRNYNGGKFELWVNGKQFVTNKVGNAFDPASPKDIVKEFVAKKTGTVTDKVDFDNIYTLEVGAAGTQVWGTAIGASITEEMNVMDLNNYNSSSTSFSFGADAVEGNIFNGLTPVATFGQQLQNNSSASGIIFVKGSEKDIKEWKKDFTNKENAAKVSIAYVKNETWNLNTNADGEGYKLVMVNGADFLADEKPAVWDNAVFTKIVESDKLNKEGEIYLEIKPQVGNLATAPTVKIAAVKTSASDPKTYVTTIAAGSSTATKYAKVINPMLGDNTYFAASEFLSTGKSVYNIYFTSGKQSVEDGIVTEFHKYMAVTSDGTNFKADALAANDVQLDSPLAQWIATGFDGKYTLTLTNRQTMENVVLKLNATKTAGVYKIVSTTGTASGYDALNSLDDLDPTTTTEGDLKDKEIMLVKTTVSKTDGYLDLTEEEMAAQVGLKFSGKTAQLGATSFYAVPNYVKASDKYNKLYPSQDEKNIKFYDIKKTDAKVLNEISYAYINKDGQVVVDAKDTLQIPVYNLSYSYYKESATKPTVAYATDATLALNEATTVGTTTTPATKGDLIFVKAMNGTYMLANASVANDAASSTYMPKNITAGSTSTNVKVAAVGNSSFIATNNKLFAPNDGDFSYVTVILNDNKDRTSLEAASRHATFENSLGSVSMQENKKGILEGIIAAEPATFWLDTLTNGDEVSFYISKGIKAAEETKADEAAEVRNFMYYANDSLYIFDEGSALATMNKNYLLEGTDADVKAIFRPATLVAHDTLTTVVDGKEKSLVKDAVKAFQYGIVLADEEVAGEYVIYSKANPAMFLYNLNGKLGFTTNQKQALVVKLGEGDATANEAIAAENVAVIAGEGVVTVKGAAGKQVVVSNILGQVIANKVATSDEETIAVAAGVAVVVVDGEATKVVVK